jgi:hypothetical protein
MILSWFDFVRTMEIIPQALKTTMAATPANRRNGSESYLPAEQHVTAAARIITTITVRGT